MRMRMLPVLLLGLAAACGRFDMMEPKPGRSSGLIPEEMKRRILSGTATASDLRVLVQRYQEFSQAQSGQGLSGHEILNVPRTGRLLVTLRDNDAGWRSELYMTVGTQTVLLVSDTREGPLNVTTEYAYLAGTPVGFFIVTYPGDGTRFTNSAAGVQCRVDYFPSVPKWVLNFEDVPAGGAAGQQPDWDYNDVVVEVQMAFDPIVDLRDCLSVSIDYLDPVGYTPEGWTIYYIGDTMRYRVNIDATPHPDLMTRPFTVYALQEYYEDIDCYRWWYPGEPKRIQVKKGDLMPGWGNPFVWRNVPLVPGRTTLDGWYTSSLEVAAGLDQTHIIIVRENDAGQIEMVVYDNPEAGIFDPPPLARP